MTDLEMLLNHRRLRHLRRCNTLPTASNEDVAQHSFYVAMLAMAIGDEYNTAADIHNLEYHPLDFDNQMEPLDMNKALRKALCHDLEEAFTGDIPWNIKHQSEEFHQGVEKAVQQHMDRLYDGTSAMSSCQRLNAECKQGNEGKLIEVVDMLELAIYSWEEYAAGNSALRPMLDKAVRLIKAMDFSSVLLKASPLFAAVMNLLENPTAASTVVEHLYDIN